MSDPNETEPNEELKALIQRAIAHLKANEQEPARKCVDEILATDPENPVGHLIASLLAKWSSRESFEHLMFVLDRDIQYMGPWELEDCGGDRFIRRLFHSLHGHQYRETVEPGLSPEEINAKYLDYATRLLAADRPIAGIQDFADVLVSTGRFDDIVKLAQFTVGEVTAEELGWPGLKKMHEPKAAREILEQAANAFDATGRYEEGSRWIFRVVQQFPDSCYAWRLLAEGLCWVGYPEEAARALIISLKNGYSPNEIREFYEPIVETVQNPLAPKVDDLRNRLIQLKDQLPPDKEQIFNDLLITLGRATQTTGTELPTTQYIEHQLGMKLPYVKRYRRPVVLPRVRSTAPFVQEIIALLNSLAGGVPQATPSTDSPVWSRQQALTQVDKEREKVKVGPEGEPAPGQQGFALYQFGVDVTEQARKGEMPPIVGRDKEIERMIRILVRTEKNNPILLGEAGVGKTAVVHGLAQRIVAGTVPPVLQGRRVIELNMGVLVAGTTYRGDFEQRITNIVKETRNNPNIILFIDEMHTLMGAGDGWDRGLDASNMMKPALANGDLRLIGATTASEYSRSIEKDPALDRRFSPIWLKEINPEQTLEVLRARQPRWAQHHGVEIDDELLLLAVQLSDQHLRHRHFPDKAIDLIDEACALARVSHANLGGERSAPLRLTREHLQQVVDDWSGAAFHDADAAADASPPSLLDELVDKLRQHVVGHEQNLQRLAAVIADEKLGVRLSPLPRVLLFAGRANSGKTETARALARVLWPEQKERFLFINMARYDDPSRLTQLVGVPPGYAASNESGLLSLHLRQYPHSIVYLYNFHRAHERILRLFVNLFTEGSFPDAHGQAVFGYSTLFILSATLDDAPQPIGFQSAAAGDPRDHQELADFFARANVPEEILEIATDVLWFDKLSSADTQLLIERHLHQIANQPGLRGLDITFDESLVKELTHRFRREPLSARNLKALLNQFAYPVIQQHLTDAALRSGARA